MSNRAWMPLHITDYLADTGHLNAAEHGAYLMLIMHYWQNGSLPSDERLLARLARMSKDEWEESRDVLAMLFGPGWTHKRIDAELAKADEIIEKRRNAALGRHSKSKSDASAVHVHSKSTDTGALPRTSNLSVANATSPKRAARLSPDWALPIDWRQDAIDAKLPPDRIDAEAAKMRDWSISSPKGAKLDWRATWRNWARQAAETMPRQRGSPANPASSTSALANSAARLVQTLRSADELRSGSGSSSVPTLIPHLPLR